MKKTKVKIPAKINFTLSVGEKKDNFHPLKSLVASINLYDTVSIKKRNDQNFTLTESGIKVGGDIKDNNAVKACVAFSKRYNTLGADIKITKRIPIGGGLGGSSADIAGALICMDALYETEGDLYSLACDLGSDVNFMMGGGYAVISGKGDDIEYLENKKKYYLILLLASQIINTRECFAEFDKCVDSHFDCTKKATENLCVGGKDFFENLKNDLYIPATKLLKETEQNYNALKEFGYAFMTGSGSTVCGVYETKKQRNQVFKKLKSKGYKVIKAQTL